MKKIEKLISQDMGGAEWMSKQTATMILKLNELIEAVNTLIEKNSL